MAWLKGNPVAGRKARYIDDDIRANNDALETAIDNEHDFTTGGTQTGRHTQGSARCFFQDAAPSTRIDGTAFTSADYGSLWVDSNSDPDNQFNILTNHSPVTWTPASTEIIAVLLAAARTFADTITFSKQPVFTKGIIANNSALQGRNQADNANVDILKITTANLLQLLTVTTLPDTSALATSAAPAANAQIANKKYVDDQIAAKHTAYSGGESHTFGDGLIVKMGYIARNDVDTTVTFNSAFPTNIISVTYSDYKTTAIGGAYCSALSAKSKTAFTIKDNSAWSGMSVTGYYWVAIGY